MIQMENQGTEYCTTHPPKFFTERGADWRVPAVGWLPAADCHISNSILYSFCLAYRANIYLGITKSILTAQMLNPLSQKLVPDLLYIGLCWKGGVFTRLYFTPLADAGESKIKKHRQDTEGTSACPTKESCGTISSTYRRCRGWAPSKIPPRGAECTSQVWTGPVDNTNDGTKHPTVTVEVNSEAA